MKRYTTILAVLTACSAADGDADDNASVTLTAGSLSGITTATDSASSAQPTDGTAADGSDDDADADDGGVKFDIGDGSVACQDRPAGSYCDGSMSIECDGNGNQTGTTNCVPGVCVADVGCVECVEGQYACVGPRVMICDTTGPSPTWQESEVCDSAAAMACDSGMGTCVPLAPIGDITPTGEYYQYAVFDLTADGFTQISDVDTYDDRIYFVAMNGSYQLTVGAYDVTLLDSDGDGMLEPNQHPSYPDAMGPIEQRTFTLVGSWLVDNPGGFPNNMELYAKSSSVVFAGPNGLRELDLAAGTYTQVAPMPSWGTQYPWIAFVGYDEINDIWYSGNEAARRVIQFDAETQTWGYAFEFPILAGDHMDGMEVVVDVTTGTPYVYVSDMTSNFIGQYRHDPDLGWVQQNLFSYVEPAGAALEGFGFGALDHFWVGSLGSTFYELGGGDLTEYIDPAG